MNLHCGKIEVRSIVGSNLGVTVSDLLVVASMGGEADDRPLVITRKVKGSA